MKTIILGLGLIFLAQSAAADIFSYQLFMDREKTEVLDIKVEVELSGKFINKSAVKSVKIWGEENNKPVLLFNIPGKMIEAIWLAPNVVNLSMTSSIRPLVRTEYIPKHSDTWIKNDHLYSFDNLILSQEGTTLDNNSDYGFFLADFTIEEMGLEGFLKNISN